MGEDVCQAKELVADMANGGKESHPAGTCGQFGMCQDNDSTANGPSGFSSEHREHEAAMPGTSEQSAQLGLVAAYVVAKHALSDGHRAFL